MKQLIIARKDLNMSAGKLAAQVSHASMAFLTNAIKANGIKRLDKGHSILPVYEYIEIEENKIDYWHNRIEESTKSDIENGREVYPQEIVIKNGQVFLKRPILYKSPRVYELASEARKRGKDKFCTYTLYDYAVVATEPTYHIESTIQFDLDTWNDWIMGSFTKIVCEAKNKYQLEKVMGVAADLGLEEGKDYFLIKDNCLTELTPEEVDENGVGRTLTCIGFRPLPDDVCAQLSKKYQLYR